MTATNTDTVRRWLEIVAGERLTHDELVEFVGDVWDPDCDWYPVSRWAESAPCHGVAEVIGFLERFWEAWEAWQTKIVSIEALDDVRLVVASHVSARGITSGVALDGELFHAFWLRHGLILRGEDHLTERGARQALGLG